MGGKIKLHAIVIFCLMFFNFTGLAFAAADTTAPSKITAGAAISTATLDKIYGYALNTSVAVDSNNKAYISYNGTKGLQYATNALGSWVYSTVETQGDIGAFSSIAVDSNNKVHIGCIIKKPAPPPPPYIISRPKLYYITNASGEWVESDTGITYPASFSMALDKNGKIHFAAVRNSSADCVVYATNTSGVWEVSTISNNIAGAVGESAIAMAIDNNNYAHVCYRDYYTGDLIYAANASGSWVIETIASFTRTPSLCLDTNNKVHISYYDDANADLKYATNSSGSWLSFTLDSAGDVGSFSSIAADSNDKVHISYRDYTNADLKYANNSSGSWILHTVDSEGNVGRDTSLAIDKNNKIHISYRYYDYITTFYLKYARID